MRNLGLAICLATLGGSLFAQVSQPKKRVAVLNFDYGAVQGGLAAIFGQNADVGKGIADILVEKLVQGGVYAVYERKELDKILAEQNLSNSDRADPASAAKIGRLLGVDAIITGSITQFGRDDRNTKVGGGAFGGLAGRYGLGGVGKRESKALVAASARLINTDTAEIMAAVSGKGESTRSGTTLLGAGSSSGSGGGGAVDMNTSNFANTILGEATAQAVSTIAAELQRNSARITARVVTIEGQVADATGDTLVLNVGTKVGVKVGDRLAVRRPSREIRDPSTGKVIRRIESSLGEVVITEADEISSVGKYAGAEPVKVGDTVRSK